MFPFFPASHSSSKFDVVISGLLTPSEAAHNTGILGEVCRILRPKGRLVLQEMAADSGDTSKDKLVSLLKLSGFVDIGQVSAVTC